MSLSFDTYVFDLDGTLLNTMQDTVDVTNKTLQHMGSRRTYSQQNVIDAFNHGGLITLLETELNRSYSEQEEQDLYTLWYELYETHPFKYTTLYPGVKETLDNLKESGAKLAVLSNKRDKDVQRTINRFLPEVFDAVHGESALIPRKPNPQGLLYTLNELTSTPTRSVYVGDSAGDVLVAHAAGTFSAAVNYGYGTNGTLDSVTPDVVISHFDELLAL